MSLLKCLEKALLGVECVLKLIKFRLDICTRPSIFICFHCLLKKFCLLWLERERLFVVVELTVIHLPLCCPESDMVTHFLILFLIENVVGHKPPVSRDLFIFSYKISFFVTKIR